MSSLEDLSRIVAEMRRKPDAHLLVEWIAEHHTWVRPDVHLALDAYFDALEDGS